MLLSYPKTHKEKEVDLFQVCKKVVRSATEAGEYLLEEYQRFDRKYVEYKGLNDMVSYVDKQAEQILVNDLSHIIPEAGFLAEEGTGEPNTEGYNWIIDPLDGTTNFIHGVPMFSVSIALIKDNELQLGVIHIPMLRECFYAVKGENAFLNGEKISVSNQTELSKSLVATGFPYNNFTQVSEYMNILQMLMKQSHGLRRMGSAAIDLAYVACGRFDAFFEHNLKPWDVAAGIIIVRQAGGIVTDFKGGDNAVFGRELIAGGNVHNELEQVIQAHFRA